MKYLLKISPRRAAFLSLLVLAVGTPSAAADGDRPSTGTKAGIYGRVYTIDEKTKGLRVLPKAEIELLGQDGTTLRGQATSDARGYYSITSLTAGSYTYRISAAGYREEDSGRGFQLQLTEGDAVIDFTIQKGTKAPNTRPPELPKVKVGQLRGQVYEKTSTGELLGVAGATVYLRKVGSRELLTVFTSSPTEGQNSSGYQSDLEAGQWQVTVQASGDYQTPPVSVEVHADEMSIQDLFLIRPGPDESAGGVQTQPGTDVSGGGGLTRFVPEVIDGGGFQRARQGLRGTVTLADASAGSSPHIHVSIEHLPDRAGDKLVPEPALLDAKGSYQVDRRPGRYVVVAEADGYLSKRSADTDVLSGSYTVVDLKLERRPADLVVKVCSAETKQPLGLATVRLRRPTDPLSSATTQYTDAAGTSIFKSTPAGDYQVLASMTGYKPAVTPVQLRAGETKPLEIDLEPDTKPATLTVKVLDAYTRDPLDKAPVKVTPPDGQDVQESVSDNKGISKITVAKPGRCLLSVSKAGYTAQQHQVTLDSGEKRETFYLVSLDPTLTLYVTNAAETPLAGVELRITPASPMART